MGPAKRIKLRSREDRAHSPHPKEKRTAGESDYHAGHNHPALAYGEAAGSDIRSGDPVEGACSTPGEKGDGGQHCHRRTAPSPAQVDERVVPGMCETHCRLRLYSIAQSAKGRNAIEDFRQHSTDSANPHPVNFKNGCDADHGSRGVRTTYSTATEKTSPKGTDASVRAAT